MWFVSIEARQNKMHGRGNDTVERIYEADRREGLQVFGDFGNEQNDEERNDIKIKVEYLRRIQLILNSKFNGGNKIEVINTWTALLLRYGAGVTVRQQTN